MLPGEFQLVNIATGWVVEKFSCQKVYEEKQQQQEQQQPKWTMISDNANTGKICLRIGDAPDTTGEATSLVGFQY